MEWTVVTALAVLVPLAAAVIKPLTNLVREVTRLTVQCNTLCDRMEKQSGDIHESFVKLWAHENDQDDKLDDHETRLSVLEHKD